MANVSNTNKKMKFGDNTEYSVNSIVEVGAIDVTKLEKDWVNSIPRNDEVATKKPIPKYTKKEMLEVGSNKKKVPGDWPNLMVNPDRTLRAARGVVASSVYTPAAPPGPCCMNDVYDHKILSPLGNFAYNSDTGLGTYNWDARANGSTLPQGPSGTQLPYVDGFWDFSLEAGSLPASLQDNPPTNSEYLTLMGVSQKWTGKVAGFGGGAARQLTGYSILPTGSGTFGFATQYWGFPPLFAEGLLSGVGMQTQINWSNSVSAYTYINSPFPSDITYDHRWQQYYKHPGEQISKPNEVPDYTLDFGPFGNLAKHIPFCQGRALINSGIRQHDNPQYHSWTHPLSTHSTALDNPEPRRMGWEGWILRPHNVGWNWGNRGAFVDVLHYTLGLAEDESNAPGNFFVDEWGHPHEWGGNTGDVLDSIGGILSPSPPQRRTCTEGYCSYPKPSLLMQGGQYLILGYPNIPYMHPHIQYEQLEHQRNCCSNSQWFQNARVLRNYTESTWNMIGSPFAGGFNKITIDQDLVTEHVVYLNTIFNSPTTGLVGDNGNGPPEGESSHVKYSCTTFYTLNRILQYISSPSDFEEIFSKDYGNDRRGVPLTPPVNLGGKRMWYPNQAGYKNKNANSNAADDPWENMYRLRNVGLFYAMVNFCEDAANESMGLGTYANLGNPPIAQLSGGQPTSQLNPGIWPWGHCITYACGNPEYSPNYDSGGYFGTGPILTYNKLGERGCEAQTPWASMPLNYYYSNITFSGIKVFFYDESTNSQTAKTLPKWSFSNSPEWSGEVPSTYEEASKSVIGFMMWLGHNSWDYNQTNSDGTMGRPAGISGSTGYAVAWWDPEDGSPDLGVPTIEGHYVYSLSNMSKKPSTNGYYKGIRPNYTYLDVVEHIDRMAKQFPLRTELGGFDYNNRPTGVPHYDRIGGVVGTPVPGTQKVGNPPTGIPRNWHLNNNSEPNNAPPYNSTVVQPFPNGSNPACETFPGEGWTSFGNVTSNPAGPWGPNDPAWGTFPSGDGFKSIGNPGGGNYCEQSMMEPNQPSSSPFLAAWGNMSTTTPCANYNYFSYKINAYLNGCFRPISAALAPVKLPAANTISLPITWPGTTYGDIKFSPGNIMGGGSILDNGQWRANCQCNRWSSVISPMTSPQLVTGPHCEGCNVGCCTDEFNTVYNTTCKYVYPQGLFKSKDDCKRAYNLEGDTIPTSMVPAFFAQQNATTPAGRRKTTTSPLGDTTFCKLRPSGIPGCMDSGALNYDPTATEDCSGSIAHTYPTPWNQAAGLWIKVDNSCCVMSETGYKCDASQGGCHGVSGLWTVATQAASPGNNIYHTIAECLASWPTAASCAQEYLRRFVKACPCGDPYIAPQHEVDTNNQIMNGTLASYDEDTYWGEMSNNGTSTVWDIKKRRGRLWDINNNPYSLNGGVIHGPIARTYTQETWWRADYTNATSSTSYCRLVWASFTNLGGANLFGSANTYVNPLVTYNDLGRTMWGANGSNRWEKAPQSTVEYQDCCLSHAYAFPGSKMFAGWITIDGDIPQIGQSFRPMEHIDTKKWQDDNMNEGDGDGMSINGNIPYKISYVADWEPRYGPNSVVENKYQINQDIVGAFGMNSWQNYGGSQSYLKNFLNSTPSAMNGFNSTACNATWFTGPMNPPDYNFAHVACPNPSPAWSLWGQFGKTGGGGIATQYPIPANNASMNANGCIGNQGTCSDPSTCTNSKGMSTAKRPAPGTTNAKLPGYDFQGDWNSFDMNYYDKWEAHGSCWYQSYNLWTDRTEQEDWKPSNTKIQKLFAQPIHYAYHCGPPEYLWKDHQICSTTDQAFSSFCLPPPSARNTGGISRQSNRNKHATFKMLPWWTGTWDWSWGWGKWMYPWKLHGGQNEREGHQTFMACYDQAENMNANLPRNI